MDINPTLLDELLKDCKTPDDLMGQKGILKQLSKALIERSLSAELTHHLGYEKHALAGKKSGNSRNGKSSKTSVESPVYLDLGNLDAIHRQIRWAYLQSCRKQGLI